MHPYPHEGGSKSITTTDNRYEGGKWITELQVMGMCTMHDDENVNRAVVAFSWMQSNS